MKVYIDIETRSDRDLKAVGSYKYSKSLVAGINCIATLEEGKSQLYDYHACLSPNTEEMRRLKKTIDKPDVLLVAHNAKFEADCFYNIYGWDIPANKWQCTQAKAAYYNLPQSLDKAGQTLNLPLLKDIGKGGSAMRKLSKVDERGRHIKPEENLELFETLYGYCKNDVAVTELLDKKLLSIPKSEKEVWDLDFNINRRGIPLDWFLIHNAVRLIEELQAKYDSKAAELTKGELKSTRQREVLYKWLKSQGLDDLLDVTAESINTLNGDKKLSNAVKAILALRQEQSSTSIAKFKKMLKRMDGVDHRIRGEFWYYGAHTGRWSGNGVQTQNLVRGFDPLLCDALSYSNIDLVKAIYDKPLTAMKNAVRGAIKASGECAFLGVDLSQIEARCAAWLSGQNNILKLYESGRDVYCETATKLFSRVITKEDKLERLTGKVAVLALGFGGGISALERAARAAQLDFDLLVSSIDVTEEEELLAKWGIDYYFQKQSGQLSLAHALTLDVIKQRWRKDNFRIVSYWSELFNAFIAGQGKCGYVKIESSRAGTRVVTLPSKRQLFYRDVQSYRDGKDKVTYSGREGIKELIKGKLFENVVQACDSDIARFYMLKAEKLAPIIHHSHDEYLLEVKSETFDVIRDAIKDMHTNQQPPWAKGLPIGFEIWSGTRYEK